MSPRSFVLSAPLLASVLGLAISAFPLTARELRVDQRGGSEFTTLRDAAAAVAPGDSIVIAKGSGPYRETLRIRRSGSAEAPIVVEGNGETITGFTTLVFHERDGAVVSRLPAPFPLVITFQGKRVLQDQASGRFLGPVTLRADGRTLELAPGTPVEGWEVSTLLNAVQVHEVSHHTYRNIVATGASNDGFSLHGQGEALLFENITGAQNLDEGFSAHGTIRCEIRGGDFWANDNGVGNVGDSVLRASDLRTRANLGWGVWLGGNARGEFHGVRSWGNGISQFRFDRASSGSVEDTLAWPHEGEVRPWVSYKESSAVSQTSTLAGAAATTDPSRWTGRPELARAAPPDSRLLALPLPAQKNQSSASATINALIREAIESGRRQVRIPPGLHRLDRTIEIRGAGQLEIDGTGASWIMTGAVQALLRIRESDRVVIRGLTFDYDPLPFTQGTITAVDAESLEFTIHQGYRDISAEYNQAPAHFFTATGARHPGSWDFNRFPLEVVSPRKGRLKLSPLPALPSVGDQVLLDRRHIDGTSAVEIRNCTGPVAFEDVTLHSSPGLCFVGRYNQDTVAFRRVTIASGPAPAGATRPRLLSGNADAVNFAQCRKGPTIEHCNFSGMGDDSLNVHGFLIPIVRVLSPTTFLAAYKYRGEFIEPMRAGDAVRIFNSGDFSHVADSALESIAAVDDSGVVIGSEEAAKLFYGYRGDPLTIFRVTLSRPVEMRAGQWFDLPVMNCPDYIVRDSYFHDHRGRGLRLMAGDGLVENNLFERLTKSAVSVGPELGYWRESGWASKVRITGNTMRDIGVDHSLAARGSYTPGVIGIFGRTDGDFASAPPENHSIVIENNRIERSPVAAIHGYAARDVLVVGNTIRDVNRVRGAGHVDPANSLVTTGPISLQGVHGAVVRDNHFVPAGTAPAADQKTTP